MPEDPRANERRAAPRRRTLKEGMIVFEGGQCTMNCRILDTSETGARLSVPNVMFMPEAFLLKIRYGTMHNCEVIWQKGQTVGVRFTD